MKNLSFFIFITLLIQFTFVIAESKTPSVASKVSDADLAELEVFANKKLNGKTDYKLVVKSLKVLLALDDEDPSRTNVMMLSDSYNKHKKIYDKAIKSLENKNNKEQLKEIKQILSMTPQNGNG